VENYGIVAPKSLGQLVQILELKGMKLSGTSADLNVHPLIIPLVLSPTGGVIGLLRWPRASLNLDVPLVISDQVTGAVRLLGLKVTDYVRKLAAEADFEELEEAEAIIELANKGLPYEKTYEAGSVKNFNRGVDRFLLTKVAAFPETYEALTQDHISKGDVTSALITAEKYCSVFGDFGDPHVFQAKLLAKEPGYDLEARDAARTALGKPLWTMNPGDLDGIAKLAGKQGVEDYANALRMSYTGPSATATKSDVALDRAARIMDYAVLDAAVSSSSLAWDSFRAELSELYETGLLPEVSKLVARS